EYVGAGVADDHLAIEHAGRAGDGVEGVRWQRVDAPQLLAALRVERDQPAVHLADEDLAIVVGDAAVHREILRHLLGMDAPDLGTERPQRLSADAIDRIDLAVAAREIEHAVHRQRRRLERNLALEVERPGEAELADVAGVDLGELAVAALVIAGAVPGPV